MLAMKPSWNMTSPGPAIIYNLIQNKLEAEKDKQALLRLQREQNAPLAAVIEKFIFISATNALLH